MSKVEKKQLSQIFGYVFGDMVRSLQRTVGLSRQQTAGIISNFQPIESAIVELDYIRNKD
ncbi:MAG: hypothetical protein HC903_17555 [Methylacidiphilales bacterium]|nr:hypothetical protein [Candidatus Methylacidiphilales bacterium]NJR16819.1 hypothetical protein [Calothrix sp. CSU_2_0]